MSEKLTLFEKTFSVVWEQKVAFNGAPSADKNNFDASEGFRRAQFFVL
jgi:hypothetical protein